MIIYIYIDLERDFLDKIDLPFFIHLPSFLAEHGNILENPSSDRRLCC